MFWQGSLKVMNKRSSININRMFIQSNLDFNNVLKMLAQKHYFLLFIYYILFSTFNLIVDCRNKLDSKSNILFDSVGHECDMCRLLSICFVWL